MDSDGGIPRKRQWVRKLKEDSAAQLSLSSGTTSTGIANIKLHVLIPDVCAGSVMGMDGQGIKNLQKSTPGVKKTRMSGECIPGADERLCYVVGDAKGVSVVLAFVADKIRDELETKRDRIKQVRLF
jgi:hypothetical protein